MSKHSILIVLAVAGLAFSGGTASAGTQPVPADCGAAAMQDKIGLPVTGNGADDVRLNNQPVPSRGDVRVIAPGEPVIQNFSADRLNLETDNAGRLIRASCG